MIRIKDYLKKLNKKSVDELSYKELVGFFEANQSNNDYAYSSFYFAERLAQRLNDELITKSEFEEAVAMLKQAVEKEVSFEERFYDGEGCFDSKEEEEKYGSSYFEYSLGNVSIFLDV